VRRLPTLAFATLSVATIAAFFVTQHLKVTTPLIAGLPRPVPGVINPYGAQCGGVDHGHMRVSFYLLHRSDDVAVYVVDSGGTIVRTLASGRHMGIKQRVAFVWNGREDNAQVAPDGIYYVRVALLHQGRTVEIAGRGGEAEGVTVKSIPPHPVVTSVSPSLIPQDSAPVTIDYRGNENRGGIVRIYRTDLGPRPKLAKSFKTAWKGHQAQWDGLIHKRPAPAGTYLVGLDVTDAACNTGRFPPLMPPVPGSTVNAGVSVRYLAAQPPPAPAPAGSKAVVYVDARQNPYRWTLWRVGARKPSGQGSQRAFEVRLKLPPAQGAGLYHVVIRSTRHSTDVPVIADYPSSRGAPRILVVLPALTWQGQNQIDDPPRDGIPNTLDDGGPIELARVLANGPPAGFADEAAFLEYLDRAHLRYDLTTDLGLIEGVGPALSGHTGVVLAGSERWIPPAFAAALRSYAQGGGHLLSLGIDSLLRGVRISGSTAKDPTQPAATDALGARPGSFVAHGPDLIAVIHDGLGIFSGTSGAFTGYRSYQPFVSVTPPAQILSAAGTTPSQPSIIGYRLGHGTVVDVGLAGFGSSLARSLDARELIGRLWKLMGG
jgi:FlgD Ig-like domain